MYCKKIIPDIKNELFKGTETDTIEKDRIKSRRLHLVADAVACAVAIIVLVIVIQNNTTNSDKPIIFTNEPKISTDKPFKATGKSIEPTQNPIIKKQPEYFLNLLKDKNIEELGKMLYISDVNYFSQIKSVDIASFNYSFIKATQFKNINNSTISQTFYNVTLDITKSQCALFSTGVSSWTLIIGENGPWLINGFYPSDREMNNIVSKGSVEYLCYSYSTETNNFTSMNPIKVTNTEIFVDMCMHAIGESCTVDEFNSYILKHYNISNLDVTTTSLYDKEKNLLWHGGHGSTTSIVNILSSVYDSDTNRQYVVLEFYGDPAYIFVAKTMKYILEKNDDGSYKLLSTELINDNGIKMFYITE